MWEDLADIQSALEPWATICLYVLGSYRMGVYTCTDGCLYMHGWVLINSSGRVLINAWTGAYVCMDGYLCTNGRVLNMHERVLVHAWMGASIKLQRKLLKVGSGKNYYMHAPWSLRIL